MTCYGCVHKICAAMPIPQDFLDLLACTFCRADLTQADEKLLCSNAKCGLRFPIRENIPVMLLDEAERPCPACSAARDLKGDSLVCPKCGAACKSEAR